jgi:hypothetical protein
MTLLNLAAEAVVVVACMAAVLGCFVLNRRIRRLASTEAGIGKAMSEMARAVDQFEKLLLAAGESTREASIILDEQLAQARTMVARLDTLHGAASRIAGAAKAPQRSATPADPLADVVPKGAAVTAAAGQSAAGGATSNGTAQERLADLARQRAMAANAAAGLGRGARA